MSPLSPTSTGIRLTVQVQPRASRNEVAGLHGDALRVRLTAPPVDGAANEALLRFLAETLEVPARAVSLVAGAASRRKVVQVEGIGAEEASRRLRLGGGEGPALS